MNLKIAQRALNLSPWVVEKSEKKDKVTWKCRTYLRMPTPSPGSGISQNDNIPSTAGLSLAPEGAPRNDRLSAPSTNNQQHGRGTSTGLSLSA